MKGLDPLTRTDLFSGTGSGIPLNPLEYGAIADGSTHPLSGFYGTLAEAQAVYSFVTALTQEIDWAACQKAVYEALGYPTFEHALTNARLNRSIYFPGGKYMFGADTLTIRNCVSANLYGDGRLATQFFANDTVFLTDGFWYSQVTGIGFQNTTTCTVCVDIDGNIPGHPYATRGVQANTFKDCHFNGATLANYTFALTRLGNPGGGAQGSENLFLNCHFDASILASFFSEGFNALQNTFIGGNFQSHQKDGIYIGAGSVYLFSVGFQSTYGYAQIVNDGYDINCSEAGVSDRITVIGCRTESLRFYKGASSQPPIIIGCNGTVGSSSNWTATTAYTSNQFVLKTSPTLGTKLYRVTTAGTSGGAEPTWPDSGTVSDGTVVWTMTDFHVVEVDASTPAIYIGNRLQSAGGLIINGTWDDYYDIVVNTATTLSLRNYTTPHRVVFCDTTSGNQTITLNTSLPLSRIVPDGTTVTIKKVTTDANTVTLAYAGGNGGESVTLSGGSTGSVTLQYSAGAGVTSKWWIIDRYDQNPSIRRLYANQGSNLAGSDFALSAGWGTTASITFLGTGSKDSRGLVTVTSAGTGQAANPTITLTFKDGAFSNQPFAVVSRGGGSQLSVPVIVNSISTTALVIQFIGTPVAAETYDITWMVEG